MVKKKLSILLIDDDENILKGMGKILHEKGVTVDTASNGLDACFKIKCDKNTYDAIVCDIHMPEMNGIEFGKKFYMNFPIIFVTGFLKDDLKDQILNICDAYIEKIDVADRIYPAVLKAIERCAARSAPVKRAA